MRGLFLILSRQKYFCISCICAVKKYVNLQSKTEEREPLAQDLLDAHAEWPGENLSVQQRQQNGMFDQRPGRTIGHAAYMALTDERTPVIGRLYPWERAVGCGLRHDHHITCVRVHLLDVLWEAVSCLE